MKKDYSWGAPVMSYGAPPMDRSVRVEPFEVVPWPPADSELFDNWVKEVQGKGRAALRPPPPPVEKPTPMRLKKPYHVRRRVLFECGCETSATRRCRERSCWVGCPFDHRIPEEQVPRVFRKHRMLATAWFVNVKGVARQLTEFVPVDGPMECKACGHDVEEAKR